MKIILNLAVLPYAAIEYDLKIAEHLGANSLRTAHYPNDEVFLDLCDEKGIFSLGKRITQGLSLEDMQNQTSRSKQQMSLKK